MTEKTVRAKEDFCRPCPLEDRNLALPPNCFPAVSHSTFPCALLCLHFTITSSYLMLDSLLGKPYVQLIMKVKYYHVSAHKYSEPASSPLHRCCAGAVPLNSLESHLYTSGIRTKRFQMWSQCLPFFSIEKTFWKERFNMLILMEMTDVNGEIVLLLFIPQ